MAAIAISFAIALGGQFISSLLTPAVEGPRLDDLSAPKSNYGVQIPLIYGTTKVAGNLIWAEDIREVKRKRKAGKGLGPKVVEYTYFADFAMLLCQGPIVGVSRIWLNSKLVYDLRHSASTKTLNESKEFANKYLRIYLGTGTQSRDPLIQSKEGTAATPAFRHRAYIVFHDLPLEEYGNRVPTMTAEVVQNGKLRPKNQTLSLFNPGSPLDLKAFFDALFGGDLAFAGNVLEAAPINLRVVVADILAKAGVESENIDLIGLTEQNIRGFVISSSTTWRDALVQLQQGFFFDVVESAGQLRLIDQRRYGVVMDLPPSSLAAHEAGTDRGEAYELTRTADLELPSEIQVNFLDPGLDYNQGLQYARKRALETDSQQQVNLPIVMSSSDARTIADRLLYLAWVRRITYKFNLPLRYLALEPSDLVRMPMTGRNQVVSITKVNLGSNLVVEIEGTGYDDTLYNHKATVPEAFCETFTVDSSGTYSLQHSSLLEFLSLTDTGSSQTYQEGDDYQITLSTGQLLILGSGDIEDDTQVTACYLLPAGVVPRETEIFRGPVGLRVFDIPLLTDRDDDYGLYAGIGSLGSTTVAGLYGSRAGGDYDLIRTMGTTLATGQLESTLPPASPAGIDQSAIIVSLFTGELSSITHDQLLAGGNTAVVGGEVIRFKDAVLIGTGRYRITNMIRGARGTEHRINTHVPYEDFTLTNQLERIDGNPGDLNTVLNFKAIRSGQSLEEVGEISPFVEGNSLKPYAPTAITGSRDGSGNLTISWSRRDRRASELPLFAPKPLSEVDERYEVDIYQSAAVVRTIGSSVPSISYSAAQQVADFGSLQGSVVIRIYQLSAVINRGYPAGATV
ncbi:MAG: hypothetical protein HC934_02930 [Acaryochloridaceae cyanobacterium SU_2_1]|nr:hypothetical protein [Acaryochloridaceae cyanobacterium SU_2_1]